MKAKTGFSKRKTGGKLAPNRIINDKNTVQSVIDEFARTTDQMVTLEEFRRALLSGKQLIMKYGVDVTAPDIHIGHAVNLWMYRRLQELGHKVIFLVGDFTTTIGDPSGRNKLRPIIPPEEIKRNALAFVKQAMMVLHDDPATHEIRYNGEWLNKLSAKDLLQLMSSFTVDKLLSRDMFRRRQKEGKEIYEHEMVYPLLQGYDSVALKADIAVIGTDQLFNEMIGRELQAKAGQAPQVVITTKITPGIDGGEKQSKSIGNYIGLNHVPREKFGRIMSIPDRLVAGYFRVYTIVPLESIAEMEKTIGRTEPMKFKLELAKAIVARYHGEAAARAEAEWFRRTFSDQAMPADAPVVAFGKSKSDLFSVLVKCFGGSKSKSDIRRLIDQNAVTVSGKTISKPEAEINLPAEVKVGKRNWFKVTV